MSETTVLHDGDADPHANIPASVRAAGAAADKLHKELYSPEPDPQPEPASDPAPVEAGQAPEPVPAAPPEADYTAPAPAADIQNDPWAARYNSMRGRFEASQKTIQQMQDQMAQLGDELVRTQALVRHQNAAAVPTNPQPATFLTPDDEQNYGHELIDLAQRAAMQAVAPELDAIKKQNLTLEQKLQQEQQSKVTATLDAALPNWREIDTSRQFLHWLSLRDVYSGLVRRDMLRKAIREADPQRVLSFFRGFLSEAHATGNQVPGAEPEPAQQQQPRSAALPLETLAAPGRVRTAGGNAPPVDDNQTFTRAQIGQFYRDVAAGRYTGRESERAATERQIFAAQNAGRVR